MSRRIEGLALPAFFSYFESPVKLVSAEDGGVAAWRLSKDTGGWVPADDLIDVLLFVGGDEIEELTRDEFVQRTEHDRGYYLRGDGPVFALYETVKAISDAQARERRYPTPTEAALVAGIRRRTFVMFEEELQRAGDPGADPSLAAPDQEA
ncbi:hypothetical protein [Micromonospora globbae]|jgi:hypothetical protein|uniref:Uncharacterized protein n=1 Tax=Micromonospora globbae TaxID=1894969 RepID=A0ABZ1S0W0_9ACTN|nr:hypothetical protein [Micromonospora globbae]WTF87254.1 hypothetical protein OH732_06630 [Micromonospora globbae]